MARQKGILKIKGTMGDMNFYRSKDGDMVREKGGIDAKRIASDPAFARTRENGAEFGEAGSSGKLLRDSLRSMMMNASDNRITARMTQKMSEILKLDSTSSRGNRKVSVGLSSAEGKAALKGFNFNINSSLGSVLFKKYAVDTTTGVISIDDLVPVNDVVYPPGATHMSILGAFANVDFATGIHDVELTNQTELALDASISSVLLTPSALPTGASNGIKLFVLKIEFFQMVNGLKYGLKNGLYNALSVVEVS